MRSATFALMATAMASSVSAHAMVWSAWVNGVDQGDGRSDYIRSPPNNNPVKDLTSADLVCNVNGGTAVPSFVSAAAGDTISFEWYHNTRGDDIIDASHKGPLITYIAEYTDTDGTGALWTKIAEDGYDGTEWAVDKLIANKGINDFTIPADLAAGKYIIRQEIIALHEADTAYATNSARGAQFYPSCVQFEITGSGSAVPDEAFDFNVGYTETDPGIVFNLYGSFDSYTIPGPEVWTGEGGSTDPVSTTAAGSEPTATTSAAAAPTTTAPGTTLATVTKPTTTPSTPTVTPGTTLATVTKPATSPSTPTVTPGTTIATVSTPDSPAPTTTAEPGTCKARKRSAKSKKAKKAKRDAEMAERFVRRVGRAQ